MPKSRHRKHRPLASQRPTSPPRSRSAEPSVIEQVLSVLRSGDAPRALALAEGLLGADPADPDLLHIAGVAATRCQQTEQAVGYLTAAARIRPMDPSIRVNLGLAQSAAGDHPGAAQSHKRACDLAPGDANAFYNLGNVLSRLDDHRGAVTAYRMAIERGAEGRADCWNNLGGALASISQHEQAVEAYQRAIALVPDHVEALNNLSLSLLKTNRADEALLLIDRVQALGGAQGDWVPRLVALRDQGLTEQALAGVDEVLRTTPEPDAYHLRGLLLNELGRYPAAMLSYLQALRLDPEHAETRLSRAIQLLQQGEYAIGWEEYEWRWRAEELSPSERRFAAPSWRGEFPIAGKVILLHAEQGQGDTLQFVRYVDAVLSLDSKVVLEVQASLVELCRQSYGDRLTVIAAGSPLPPFDAHCPLLSLPFALRHERGSQPLSVEGYLQADPARLGRLSDLVAEPSILRVGLVWRGNPKHRNDRNRSLTLASLLPSLPLGPDYVVLQQSVTEAEQTLLAQRPDIRLTGHRLNDFSETAALCATLSLVLSVDTSVAHLAGALGVPCWVMLPFNPDFRWLLRRGDTPWYPSMRLLRQSTRGDWSNVLGEVRVDLGRLLEQGSLHRAA